MGRQIAPNNVVFLQGNEGLFLRNVGEANRQRKLGGEIVIDQFQSLDPGKPGQFAPDQERATAEKGQEATAEDQNGENDQEFASIVDNASTERFIGAVAFLRAVLSDSSEQRPGFLPATLLLDADPCIGSGCLVKRGHNGTPAGGFGRRDERDRAEAGRCRCCDHSVQKKFKRMGQLRWQI